MIDIKKAKEAFKEYIKNYDITNKKILLKLSHIERTSNVSKTIAQNLGLEKEDIQLAELIGLLHDIGRFEQLKKYNTFNDKKSINHGQCGVKILFEDELIRKFVEENKYDEIIKKSILNHNRAKEKIENDLTEKELLHTKIIRDADKTDIFYCLSTDTVESIYETSELRKEKITDKIYNDFINLKPLDYKDLKTHADTIIAHFAYVYDLNFSCTCEVVKENNYLEKMYNRFKFNDDVTEERCKTAYEMAKKYIYNKK